MANEINTREGSLVKLQTKAGEVVGAGFFYSPRHVICCASSVAATLGIIGSPPLDAPAGEVPVYMEGRPVQAGHIQAWFTLQGEVPLDFAVIEFNTDILPPGGQAHLGVVGLAPGSVFEAMGFLPGVGSPILAAGSIAAEIAPGTFQIQDSSPDGRLSMPGYNGAPIWDVHTEAIVAIVSVREDENGQALPTLVTVEALAKIYSGLPVRLPEDRPGPLFDVPELPEHYYDRPDDYNRLRAAVLSGRVLPRPSRGTTSVTIPSVRSDTGPTETLRSERIVLQGMPGIGKSVLAAALARDQLVRRLFPDGVFWIHLGPDPDIPLLQARIAMVLGEPYAAFQDARQGRRVLRGLLYARSSLVILDDVWNRSHARAFDCMGREGLLLLTARDVGLAGELSAHRVPLSQMAAAEGAELLRRWAGASVDTPAGQLIPAAAACSYIPVVLKLFGPLLPTDPDYWPSVIDQLNTTDYAGLAARLPTFSFPILLRAIRLAWNLLPVDLRARFLDLAVFPFNTLISVNAVRTFWRTRGFADQDIEEILESLARRALIDAHRSPSGSISHISLHGLQANYLRWIAGTSGHGDLPALHRSFIGAYGVLPPGHDGYILDNLVYHLRSAGMVDELRQVLFDFRYLQQRLETSGFDALLSDFRVSLSGAPVQGAWDSSGALDSAADALAALSVWAGCPDGTALALVYDALRRSAPRIAGRASALAAQLLGQLDFWLQEDRLRLGQLVRDSLQDTRIRPEYVPDEVIKTIFGRLRPFLDGDDISKFDSAGNTARQRVADLFSQPTDPAAILVARLEVFLNADFQRLLNGALNWRSAPWLRPVTAALARHEAGLVSNLYSTATAVLSKIAPSGRRALSASQDGSITIWDLESASIVQRMEAHEGTVTALAFTPDGQRFLSGGSDGRVLIWNLQDGEWLGSLVGHTGRVLSLAISPDNRRAVSGSADGHAFIWDLETLELLRQVALAGPIRSLIILPGSLQSVSAGLDIRIWDLETGFIIFTLTDHTAPVVDLALSANGQMLLSCSEDCTLRLWDVGSGQHLRTLRSRECPLIAAEFIPGTPFLISGQAAGRLVTWDMNTGRIVGTRLIGAGRLLSLSVSPDGRRCLTTGGAAGLQYWDLENHRLLQTLQGHSAAATVVKLFMDGTRVVSASEDGSVRVWHAASGEQLARFDLAGQSIMAVAVTRDNRYILAGLESGQLAVWALNPSDTFAAPGPVFFEAHIAAILAMDISTDGLRLVTASADANLVVWELTRNDDGSLSGLLDITVLRGHTSWVRGVKFFRDGWRVVSVSADRTIKVWNAESGKLLYSIAGHEGEINDVAILGDQPRFVTAGDDQVLRIWDAITGRPLFILSGHVDEVTGVAASRDGKRIVSVAQDRTVRVWALPRRKRMPPRALPDLTGTRIEQALVLSGHMDWINRVAITPDGKRAITASSDHHLRSWDISADGTLCLENSPARPGQHPGGLAALAFSPDGRSLASAGRDGRLMVWNLDLDSQQRWRSQGVSRTLAGATGFSAAAFLAGDRYIAAAGQDGRIRIWEPRTAGEPRRFLAGHQGAVTGLLALENGWQLASAGEDGRIGIWDPLNSALQRWLQSDTAAAVLAMEVFGDGKHLLSVDAGGTLRIWDHNSGQIIGHAQLASPNQQLVTVAICALDTNTQSIVGAPAGQDEVMAWLWDLSGFSSAHEPPRLIPAASAVTLPLPARALSFCPKRPWALIAHGGRLMAWDFRQSTILPLYEGESEFLGLGIHPHGEVVAAGDLDGNCHILALED